ncbi:MAG: glycosyltransferase [Verrucomicrobia bacterium]|nr:glycosyltransferase [Verrucomicrobiota bacterium]
MEPSNASVVWLAYVSYPVTTAVYYERALRRNCRVVTLGPKIGPEIIKGWNLEAMKLPVLDHDVPLSFEPDMKEVFASARERFPAPDLYLWIESVPGHFPKNLDSLKCPKACILIDSHLNLDWHVKWALNFDHVFIAQREYLEAFRRHGCKSVHWLPLACDPEVHSKKSSEKAFDIGFVGSVFENSQRAHLLKKLAERRFHVEVERCFWHEMALVFSKSRVVFNNAVRNDLNMRVFEALSTGSFLLTDVPAKSGQNELFEGGVDLGIYDEANIVEKARHYLIREEEREHIARRGQSMVHKAHTYSHRVGELLQVMLHGKSRTPNASEWRERSLVGLPSDGKWSSSPPSRPKGRSFIIPVIDGSEKGRREFGALLEDLKRIEGEVIVIFNSPEAAEAFRDHPRIDISASLNINSGVSRAWNIGVHLSSQPSLFILNADLRIGPAAVEGLEKGLWELPAAAIVGPEGSFFGFYTYEDIIWFHREARPSSPQLVDAVSGFFFAVKRELFLNRVLQFEDRFTPCFTEEWDLGLQARQAGYCSYVVPVKDYQHEWGISSQPNRTIRYLKNQQARAREIIARNRIHFWRKWLVIAGELQLPQTEPNGPMHRSATGSQLLQSKIVELSAGGNPPK